MSRLTNIGKSMKNILSSKLTDVNGSKNVIILYIFTLIVVFLGTSKSIFSVYMPDDYLLASTQMPISFYLNQGRFIQAITTMWFNHSNINVISASSIFTPVFIMLVAGAASIFVYLLADRKVSLLFGCLLSAVIACHPAFSMMAVYHMSTMLFSISAACFCAYMIYFDKYSVDSSLSLLAVTTLLVVVMCGTYQPFFVAIIIFTASYILIKGNFTLSIKNIMKVAPVVVGLILYMIIFKITKNLAGHNDWDNRAGLLTNIPERIHEVINFLPSLFFRDWWLITWQFSAMLSICMLAAFITFIFSQKRTGIVLRIILSGFVFAITILPIAILKDWDPSSRAMFSVSFSYAVVMIVFFNEKIIKTKCVVMGLAVLLGLISSNHYLYTVEMDQKGDEAMVQTVYGMLSTTNLEGKEVSIVNNQSIKVAQWALNGIFYFNTGKNFNIVGPSEVDVQKCASQDVKPSLVQYDNKVVICLN